MAYAIPGVVVDGNDVTAVHDAAETAVARARAGKGPLLLECKTYRWRAHFESDYLPDLRPLEEIEEWKKRCPVAFMEKYLLDRGIIDTEELNTMNNEILAQVQDAVDYALQSPDPEPEDALEDIFSN